MLSPSFAFAVDHSQYDQILKSYVDGGYFDYESFASNSESVNKLKDYLEQMSTVQPETLQRNEALAYWINLYNAATIGLVSENYPLDSIRDLGGWVTSVFEKKFIDRGNKKISLDKVEHEIIRPNYDEPRIHFALVCAAKSCPPLRDEAYVGNELDQQLESQTQIFLDSQKNTFKVSGNTLEIKLSKILYWYGEDFGGENGVIEFISPYLDSKKQTMIQNGNFSITYYDYDWSLNQAPGPYSLN